jgi:hypothetical protein
MHCHCFLWAPVRVGPGGVQRMRVKPLSPGVIESSVTLSVGRARVTTQGGSTCQRALYWRGRQNIHCFLWTLDSIKCCQVSERRISALRSSRFSRLSPPQRAAIEHRPLRAGLESTRSERSRNRGRPIIQTQSRRNPLAGQAQPQCVIALQDWRCSSAARWWVSPSPTAAIRTS